MEILKKKMAVASLVIAVLLLSTFAFPVVAKPKQQDRFEFHSVVKGAGIVYWGIANLPTVQWGTLEYSDILDDGELNIAGSSDAQEVSAVWPAVKMFNLINIQLDKMELRVKWTYEDTRYELCLRFLSTIDTDGMYGEAWRQSQAGGYDTLGDVAYLGVNLDYADLKMFNPEHSTLQFEGTYKVNDEEPLAITGHTWIAMDEFLGTGFYGKAAGLYLWIDQLSEYATIAWRSEQLEITGWEQVPPAQVITIYLKEKK